jgi:hypothetical protein
VSCQGHAEPVVHPREQPAEAIAVLFPQRLSARLFAGRICVDRERVHATGEIGGEDLVDHAVAFEPALACERSRYDIDPEMGLAARSVTGMAVMLFGLIDHLDAVGRESFLQPLCDVVLHQHALRLSPVRGPSSTCKRRDDRLVIVAYEKNVNAGKINPSRVVR